MFKDFDQIVSDFFSAVQEMGFRSTVAEQQPQDEDEGENYPPNPLQALYDAGAYHDAF